MNTGATRICLTVTLAAALSVGLGCAWLPAADAISWPTIKDLPPRAAMPDPLVDADGQKITVLGQWPLRREQMKQVLEHYALGKIPPAPGNVTGREIQSRTLLEGRVVYRLVHLTFGPGAKLGFDAALFVPVPTDALKAPFATIVQPSFSLTPGVTPPPPETATSTATNGVARKKSNRALAAVTPEAAVVQYEAALRRGYAIMTFYYQQCGVDQPEFRQTGFFPAYPDYDWGSLAAWAWAMSRCVDYLETQAFADKSRFIALGHSRLGKTALVAGAFDERFALTAPAGSGCGGTGAYRFNGKGRGGKEGLEEATQRFPQWFGPRLPEFAGQVEKLPFDQHWFMALIAPRLFIAADGLDDSAANANALAQAYRAAQPVFAFLNVPEHLGIHFRPGKHMLAPEDWAAILDFSDQQLSKRPVNRRFDQIPPVEQLH